MTQSVFISGAASGIGLVTAQRLDGSGWRVFAADLPDCDFTPLTHTTSKRLIPVLLDISDTEALSTAAQRVAEHTGNDGLQGLVNNAGIQIAGALETLPVEQLRRQFEVNVFGHFQVTQAMLPLLRQAQGRIVNVSSLMGRVAMPVLGAYSMSKHALEAMSDVLRLELASSGITVSLIEPGAIQTPMTHSMNDLLTESRSRVPDQLQGIYDDLYDGMQSALEEQSANATSPEVVADAIIHALTSHKPRTRYAIGGGVKGLLMMRRLAPDDVADKILKRALNLK